MAVQRIDIQRFNALAAHSRSPAAAFISRELDWFANDTETLLATLMLDTEDGDYVGIILGRDESGRFRCIDIGSPGHAPPCGSPGHAPPWRSSVRKLSPGHAPPCRKTPTQRQAIRRQTRPAALAIMGS
jgi:hypothetical protein